jgi:hypothetical protein
MRRVTFSLGRHRHADQEADGMPPLPTKGYDQTITPL